MNKEKLRKSTGELASQAPWSRGFPLRALKITVLVIAFTVLFAAIEIKVDVAVRQSQKTAAEPTQPPADYNNDGEDAWFNPPTH